MALPPQQLLFDEILNFLASAPSQQEIVAFRPSDNLQARASELLDKNRSGDLSSEERIELDEFQRMNHFITMLKAKAREKLT
ncbi:MAG: hypothetical protein Q9P01_04320 [Anaerolineae bacterium]|nr:hypothetical protein [Anaerolineae bacterium]MDQ7034068.1 hypothetical protein [Anaerolineae bacterium]